MIRLHQPTPREARAALRRCCAGLALPVTTVDDLELALHEAVTNALRHGTPPVTVRIGRAAGRPIVTVHDAGPGPDPGRPVRPGHGTWLLPRLCQVAERRTLDGYTIELTPSPWRA